MSLAEKEYSLAQKRWDGLHETTKPDGTSEKHQESQEFLRAKNETSVSWGPFKFDEANPTETYGEGSLNVLFETMTQFFNPSLHTRVKNFLYLVGGFHLNETRLNTDDDIRLFRVHRFFHAWPVLTFLMDYRDRWDGDSLVPDAVLLTRSAQGPSFESPLFPTILKFGDTGKPKTVKATHALVYELAIEALVELCSNKEFLLKDFDIHIVCAIINGGRVLGEKDDKGNDFIKNMCPYSNKTCGMATSFQDNMWSNPSNNVNHNLQLAILDALQLCRGRMLLQARNACLNYILEISKGTAVGDRNLPNFVKCHFLTWVASECTREAAYLLKGVIHVSDCSIYNQVHEAVKESNSEQPNSEQPAFRLSEQKATVPTEDVVLEYDPACNPEALEAKSVADLVMLVHKHDLNKPGLDTFRDAYETFQVDMLIECQLMISYEHTSKRLDELKNETRWWFVGSGTKIKFLVSLFHDWAQYPFESYRKHHRREVFHVPLLEGSAENHMYEDKPRRRSMRKFFRSVGLNSDETRLYFVNGCFVPIKPFLEDDTLEPYETSFFRNLDKVDQALVKDNFNKETFEEMNKKDKTQLKNSFLRPDESMEDIDSDREDKVEPTYPDLEDHKNLNADPVFDVDTKTFFTQSYSEYKRGRRTDEGKKVRVCATPLSNEENGAAGEGLAAEPQTGEGDEHGLAALMAGAKIGC